MSKYKAHIKSSVRNAAFDYLKRKLQTHTKVSHISYDKLETQGYMTSPLFTNIEVNMLHALRSRCADVKANFKQKYLHTHLRCPLCDDQNGQDDQQHIILCKTLKDNHKSNKLGLSWGSTRLRQLARSQPTKFITQVGLYLTFFHFTESKYNSNLQNNSNQTIQNTSQS